MKIPIKILSTDFAYLGVIDDYESLIFTRRFYEIGSFQIDIEVNKLNTDKLVKDNLIRLGNNNNRVGIIRSRRIELNEDGVEILTVLGFTLKSILSRRLIVPDSDYDRQEGLQEDIMKSFVKNNLIETSESRKIEQLVISDSKGLGVEDKWRARYENLADKLEEIGRHSELGWDVILDTDNKKFVFDVFQGRNLTTNQSDNPPVIFSTDFHNIKGQSYEVNHINNKTIIYAAGENKDEEDRLIQAIGDAKGLDRIEEYVDLSSAENIDELKKLGKRELDSQKEIVNFESQVLDFGSFVFEEDYFLGDYVTTKSRDWDLEDHLQITETIETIDIDGYSLELLFGEKSKTFLDDIKELKRVERK